MNTGCQLISAPGRRLALRAGLRKLLLFLLLATGLPSSPLPAQTNPPAVSPSPGRYLIILETSTAMRRRTTGTRKAIESLMKSTLRGELRSGDTLGVWTYNDLLQAGRFPLQTWTPETAEQFTAAVTRFVNTQTNGGASRFDLVMPALQKVVEVSPRLTVILVSDGDEPIQGTPYDFQIERALADKYKQQQRARMPFITVFRMVNGKVTGVTVNLAPWPVEFPAFPPEPKPKPEAKPVVTPQAPPPTAPPLVVIGNKRLDPTEATNAVLAAATNPVPSVASPAPGSEAAPTATDPPPTNEPKPETPTRTEPLTNSPPASNAATQGEPTNASSVNEPPRETSLVIPTNPPATTESVLVAPPTEPPPVQPQINLPSPAAAPAEDKLATPPKQSEPPPEPSVPTTEVAPVTPETKPATTEATGESKPVPTQPPPVVSAPNAEPAKTNSATLATATPSRGGGMPWIVIGGGLIPIAVGVAVIIHLQNRSRKQSGSLISHSLDRHRK